MKPAVISLEFGKEGVFSSPYKEGQYIFINAPTVAYFQWHPFTLSSAPEEKTVTVHIRTQGEGTWTAELMKKFEQMGPKQAYFRLARAGPQGQMPGKILGPEGKPLLSVDGPHSAPTQHVGEYGVVMVVGAGIGVTPVAATLKSVIFHRWKYFIGQCFPDHAYFMWVCGYNDIDAFRWLIRSIKDAQDEVVHMRYNNPEHMATKTFAFHIWITSVPKDAKPVDVVVDDEAGFWGVPREDAKVEKVRANFGEEDIYRVMKCPGKHTQLGDVHIWNGRPEWEPRFEEVAKKHPKGDVGVAFCGNPFIAKDLSKNCHMASHGRKDGLFILHKENF
jgi:NADPH oxidase